jgi:hypothetical protein
MIVASLTSGQNLDVIALAFGSLVVALIFITLRTQGTLNANEVIRLGSRMGQGQWDFTQSFATNITLIGSVLTLILTSSSVPAITKILPSDAYGRLAVFFGILVVIAPLFYNGTVIKVTVSPDQFDTGAEYHGTVWGFLLAALVTCWGLLGSVATAFLTLLEIDYDGGLSIAVITVLAVALSTAVVFFGFYTWIKIDGSIVDQFDPAAHASRIARSTVVRAAMNLAAPTAQQPPPAPRLTFL